MTNTTSTSAGDQVPRLRLKRLFLWTMVASLAVGAAIAVVILLVGEFNDTNGRILGTLGALAFHCAVAMVCADSLEKRRWPALSVVALVAFGVNFVVLVTCIWLPSLPEDDLVRAILDTPALLGYYLLAIPCAAFYEQRRRLPVALGGLAACVLGLLTVLICIWAPHTDELWFPKLTAIIAIVAFSFAHTSLLMRVRAERTLAWLLRGSIACVWAIAAMASAMIALELDGEFEFRVLGALGVLDACGSLGLVIMTKLRQVQKVEQLTTTAAEIELRCPRCTTAQTVQAGPSRCSTCGLKFRIEIEEPRCAKCDYLLWQLPERRCPECGTPFWWRPVMRGDAFFSEIAKRPPFTKLHPQIAAFFKRYFAHEKVVRFGERFVINTHFPPFPSPAFDNLVANFEQVGEASTRRLYSVTWAVTNRCPLHCWHCYNAGRSEVDLLPTEAGRVVRELQSLGTVMVTLTGGEPLVREDLDELIRQFDDRTCLILGTSGVGFSPPRARRLREAGLFAVGISLDSLHAEEHDRLRGQTGAFRAALDALATAREAGLYAYVVSVATREFLQPEHFHAFMRFAGEAGALEVHLLEPTATGRLAGRTDVLLNGAERRRLFEHQEEVAADDSLPILSAYAYLESPDAFGCGAGLTHLYIDGSGEVCPCQLVPLSFGNVGVEPLAQILDRMGAHFRQPRAACVSRLLTRATGAGPWPTAPAVSQAICEKCLPQEHAVPTFFRVRSAAREEVGAEELRAAYDHVHGDYDEFWLSQAARPIQELIRRMRWRGDERVFEAGCGTGYATALLAQHAARVVAVDLSAAMLAEARIRLRDVETERVEFLAGDALEVLPQRGTFDVVFSSWVLGYIPLTPFFAAARDALAPGGRLAFVVHKENSPREPLEIFAELVAEDPAVLRKRVAFDFPRDADHLRKVLVSSGFVPQEINDGAVVFHYRCPEEVLDHLLKSGAGTAFYEAIDPQHRARLSDEFLRRMACRHKDDRSYEVRHDYLACIAGVASRDHGRLRT